MGDASVLDSIQPFSSSADDLVRSAVIDAMCHLAPSDVVAQISGFLKDESASVRVDAIETLVRLESKDYLPAIFEMIDDSAPEVQAAVMRVMGKFGNVEQHDILKNILRNSTNCIQKVSAVLVLGSVYDDESLDLLIANLGDYCEDYEVNYRRLTDAILESLEQHTSQRAKEALENWRCKHPSDFEDYMDD